MQIKSLFIVCWLRSKFSSKKIAQKTAQQTWASTKQGGGLPCGRSSEADHVGSGGFQLVNQRRTWDGASDGHHLADIGGSPLLINLFNVDWTVKSRQRLELGRRGSARSGSGDSSGQGGIVLTGQARDGGQ